MRDEWINEMWYIFTMECYLVIKRNEILIHANTGKNLKNMLGEKNQTQKAQLYNYIYMTCPNRQIYKFRK